MTVFTQKNMFLPLLIGLIGGSKIWFHTEERRYLVLAPQPLNPNGIMHHG